MMDTGVFYDCRKVRALGYPFNILWGGRGIGKTYSALEMSLEDNIGQDGAVISSPRPFAYMRRMAGQATTVTSKSLNPFKKLNTDHGWRFFGHTVSKTSISEVCMCDEKWKPCSEPVAYAIGLNTMGSMRGADMSDVSTLIWDEISQTGRTDKYWAEEGNDFLNAYETFNRNREYFGEPPLQCFLLSNAVSLQTPVTDALGVSDTIEEMVRNQERCRVVNNRVYLEFCEADISKYKRDTVLYQTVGTESDFAKHALDNEFVYNNLSQIRPKVPLNEYRPFVQLPGYYIYSHKSRGEFYACETPCNAPKIPQTTDRLFLAKYDLPLRRAALYGQLYYSCYRVKRKVLSDLKLMQ